MASFSTNASGGEEGEGDAEMAGGGSGSGGGGDGGGEVKTVEEDPLAGMVPDDGDPGPPPPLDPSIVTGPSPKVGAKQKHAFDAADNESLSLHTIDRGDAYFFIWNFQGRYTVSLAYVVNRALCRYHYHSCLAWIVV